MARLIANKKPWHCQGLNFCKIQHAALAYVFTYDLSQVEHGDLAFAAE